MKQLAYATLLLAACTAGERAATGQCPAGETCSPKTPRGLHFLGAPIAESLFGGAPLPTAVGGTQTVQLEYDPTGNGNLVPLDLPFTVDDDGGAGIATVATSGSSVTIQGHGAASNYLRILDADDGTLFDRMELTAAELESIELEPTDFQRVPDHALLAWAPGERTIGVSLKGEISGSSGALPTSLVDDSMDLALAGADRPEWDTLHMPNATLGTSPIAITAGDKPAASLDFVVTQTVDAIQPWDLPLTIAPHGHTTVCFQALAGDRFVVDLPWTYTVDGTTMTEHGAPCFQVETTKTTGSVMVTASAAGATATATLTVSTATATATVQAAAPAIRSTAGERAARM